MQLLVKKKLLKNFNFFIYFPKELNFSLKGLGTFFLAMNQTVSYTILYIL